MSFKVMIIPEDPTDDRYILQPLVRKLLNEAGKSQADVHVLTNPKVGGYSIAKAAIPEVLNKYQHFDLFLFLPDADGKDRTHEFQELETRYSAQFLLCCAAVQEVEAWLLAGRIDKLTEQWNIVREDIHVKENYFEPFLEQYGNTDAPGGGREALMKTTLQNIAGLLKRSPELGELLARMKGILG